MGPTDIPLFHMLRGRLGWLSSRQTVISENVANADTPRFVPRDMKPFKIARDGSISGAASGLAMARTSGGHIAGQAGGRAPGGAVKAPDSETTLDGNAVVLEEQMIKLTDARMDYEAAIGLYQKAMGMMKTAIRRPGG